MRALASRGARHAVIVAIVGLCSSARPAFAQEGRRYLSGRMEVYAFANVVSHTAVALYHAHQTHTPIGRAIGGGIVGGWVGFTGQQFIGSGMLGARFLGLQMTAFGASLSRNAGRGGSFVSDLEFPVTPFLLETHRDTSGRIHPRVRVLGTSLVGLFAPSLIGVHGRRTIDWRESLISGVPIFIVDSLSAGADGRAFDGVVFLKRSTLAWYDKDEILAHEIGHVAQYQRDVVLDGLDLNGSALARFGGQPGRLLNRYLALPVVMIGDVLNGGSERLGWMGRRVTFYERETEAMRGHDVCADSPSEHCLW